MISALLALASIRSSSISNDAQDEKEMAEQRHLSASRSIILFLLLPFYSFAAACFAQFVLSTGVATTLYCLLYCAGQRRFLYTCATTYTQPLLWLFVCRYPISVQHVRPFCSRTSFVPPLPPPTPLISCCAIFMLGAHPAHMRIASAGIVIPGAYINTGQCWYAGSGVGSSLWIQRLK